jgi:hypothetical protein
LDPRRPNSITTLTNAFLGSHSSDGSDGIVTNTIPSPGAFGYSRVALLHGMNVGAGSMETIHRPARFRLLDDVAKIATTRLSDVAKVASAAGVNTHDDQNERYCIKHPTRMMAARRPKVAESAEQVGAANK